MGSQERNSKVFLNKLIISALLAIALLAFLIMPGSKTPVHYSWLVPVFPLVSFGLILLFGMQDSERGGSIALLGASFSSVFSLSIAYDVFINDAAHGSFIESTRVWFSGST